MSVTSVRLNSEIEAPLKKLSKKLDRSKSYIINQALKEYIQRQTMVVTRWNDTLQALDSVKSGKAIDASEVHSWLESWGTNNEKATPGK